MQIVRTHWLLSRFSLVSWGTETAVKRCKGDRQNGMDLWIARAALWTQHRRPSSDFVLGRFELNGRFFTQTGTPAGGPSTCRARSSPACLFTSPAPYRSHGTGKNWQIRREARSEAQSGQNFRQVLFRLRRMLGRDVLPSNGDEVSLRRLALTVTRPGL